MSVYSIYICVNYKGLCCYGLEERFIIFVENECNTKRDILK